MESLSISLVFYDVPAICFFIVSKFAKKDKSASYEIKNNVLIALTVRFYFKIQKLSRFSRFIVFAKVFV